MVPATSFDLSKAISTLFKQVLLWGPIVGGLVHQFVMFVWDIERIYVFVNPPEYLEPFVSLEYQWWFVLLLGSSLMCILAYTDRLQSIPTRFAVPFYVYILFLLLLVKPV
jgi:hypothetical protein